MTGKANGESEQDKRQLNFLYQGERTDGQQSNIFRLESPKREDA